MPYDLPLPPESNAYYDHRHTYRLHPELIFVFGSNEKGIHGCGSAKIARFQYGAVLGQGVGLSGWSYAIPTKAHPYQTLPLDRIEAYVAQFIQFTQTQDYHYYVVPIGTQYAGYDHCDIAPLFQGVRRCWLPTVWAPYLVPA